MSTTTPGPSSRLVVLENYAEQLARDVLPQIRAARLLATVEPTPVDDVARAGYVIAQDPQPGADLRRNSMVTLYVGDHPDAVLTPPKPQPQPPPRRRRAPRNQPSLFDPAAATASTPQSSTAAAEDPPSVALTPDGASAPEPSPQQANPPESSLGEDRAPEPPADLPAELVSVDVRDAAVMKRLPAIEPPATTGPSAWSALAPDSVQAYRQQRADRHPAPRRRSRRRVRRLSRPQALAAAVSALATVYLVTTLIGHPHPAPRAHHHHRSAPVASTSTTATTASTRSQTTSTPPKQSQTTNSRAVQHTSPSASRRDPRRRPEHSPTRVRIRRVVVTRAAQTVTVTTSVPAPANPAQPPAAPAPVPTTTTPSTRTGRGSTPPASSHHPTTTRGTSVSPVGTVAPSP